MNGKLLIPDTTKNQFIEQYISESMLDLGVKANRKGFIYIKEAIKIYPEIMNASKKIIDLYTIIAEHYNVTSVSVERAIRALLERTWCSENMNTSHVIFDCPSIYIDLFI